MAQANVTIGVKSSAFKSGLDDMRSQAQQWGGDIKSTIAGAFALGAITSFVSGFVSEMARVKDLADRLGESSDSIQRVGNAAKLSGSDLEFVIKNLTKMAAAAAAGSDKFEAVGISSAAFANAGTEDRVLMLAKAFDECNGSQAEMAKLMDLLGPKGQDMLIMLSQGAEELNKQMREVPIVTASAVAAMATLDDAVDTSKQFAYEWAGSVVGLFLHANAALKALTDTMDGSRSFSFNYQQNIESLQNDKPTGGKNKDIDTTDAEAAAKDKEDTEKAGKKLAEEVLQLQRSRMNAEEKLADLKREQAKHDAESVDYSKSETDRTNSKIKSVQIQRDIEAAQLDISKKKKDIEEKTASAQKSQDEELVKLLRSRMDAEQKIADLKREQAEYSAAAKDSSKTDEQRAVAGKKALQIQQEIESQQNGIEKDKKEKAEKDAKDAEAKAKEAAKAQSDLADKHLHKKNEKMKPEDRIKELKKQQKELNDAAAKETDPKAKAEKKLEALKLNDAIDAAMKETDKSGKSKPSVISSSLASVGGGGGAYVGTDPALTEARRTNNILASIDRKLGQGGSSFTAPRNPF
jgi:myosin heavy subunit